VPADAPTAVPTAEPSTTILVAVQQLPRGLKVPPGAVDAREWPVSAVPANAIVVPDGVDPQVTIQQDVVGKIVRSDIAIEQPVLSTLLVPDLTQIAAEGSDAAAILPQGLVAVSMPMDRLSGVAYAIQDGDRVDVILSFVLVDVDEEFQSILPNQVLPTFFGATNPETGAQSISEIVGANCTGADANRQVLPCTLGRIETIPPGELANVVPAEPQRPRLVSQRTIESALVIHVGEFSLEGGRFIGLTATPTIPPATPTPVPDQEGEAQQAPAAPTVTPTPTVPDIITLGVTPQDAVVLTWAVNSAVDINLALRSARDVPQVPTTSVTLQYMIETYNITVPPKLPYSLEPSIRTIGIGGELPTVTPQP
jgi:Flp pilus assembly protein CpaB